MSTAERYREVSRLEGFSDAVFGFALTLLVVSLETPSTAEGLRVLAGGFVPFALMFAMVSWIWYEHNVFFRRYGLQDPWTVFLNSVLLFVVLFYVYPLKFLTVALIGHWFLPASAIPSLGGDNGPMVMVLYSGGVLLIFGVFSLLHRHAWKLRHVLELSTMDELKLKYSMQAHLMSASLAIVSLILIWLLPLETYYAGFVYGLMAPLHAWNGYSRGRAMERLEKGAAEAASDTDETEADA